MIPINQVLHGDCLEIMPEFPDNIADLVLTDPPFFLPAEHYQSRVKWQRNFADLSPLKTFWRDVTKEVVRVLKPTGHFIVFSNCDSYPVFYEPMYNHFDKLTSIVWDKKRIGLGYIWRHQHELIIAARWRDSKVNKIKKTFRDVISIEATPSGERQHPVEKPWRLLAELIAPTTLEGDVVIDPFCGSGTTLKAAKMLGRRYIGIDLNANYVDVSFETVKPEINYEGQNIIQTSLLRETSK